MSVYLEACVASLISLVLGWCPQTWEQGQVEQQQVEHPAQAAYQVPLSVLTAPQLAAQWAPVSVAPPHSLPSCSHCPCAKQPANYLSLPHHGGHAGDPGACEPAYHQTSPPQKTLDPSGGE